MGKASPIALRAGNGLNRETEVHGGYTAGAEILNECNGDLSTVYRGGTQEILSEPFSGYMQLER